MYEQNPIYTQNTSPNINQSALQPQINMTQAELRQRAFILKEEKEKKDAKNFIIAWLITMLAPFVLEFIGSFFYGGLAVIYDSLSSGTALFDLFSTGFMLFVFVLQFARLASHIIIIVGKCKYPKNKSINIAFWIDMAMIICYFIFCIFAFFVLSFTCAYVADSCSDCSAIFGLL